MINIYKYLNYNQYLKDWYESQKAENEFFSYRYMGRRLLLDPGFLVKVLQGKMPLSKAAIPRVIDFCGLKGKEAEYFDLLVHYGRAKSPRTIAVYFEKLLSLKEMEAYKTEKSEYEFYQKWYHTAIRCMLAFKKLKANYSEFGKSLTPPISAKEVKKSLQLLEALKFIKKNKDGLYEITEATLTTGDQWKSVAIRKFQLEMIRMGGESLERHPKETRDISTITVAINARNLKEIKSQVKKLRQSILQLNQKGQEIDSVYQINMQIFPLSKVTKGMIE
ncbi:MAG: TIGR02147 family protein [Fibrobacteria bacterium]|nr:TIGR02147 family protein [Fibrobacteria bacterium]